MPDQKLLVFPPLREKFISTKGTENAAEARRQSTNKLVKTAMTRNAETVYISGQIYIFIIFVASQTGLEICVSIEKYVRHIKRSCMDP